MLHYKRRSCHIFCFLLQLCTLNVFPVEVGTPTLKPMSFGNLVCLSTRITSANFAKI